MAVEIYDIPGNFTELFNDVEENGGSISYRIINYNEGMDMDNIQSMQHFIDSVGIYDDYIEEDNCTQIILSHPEYLNRIVIDSGGLGDFFSHGFECYWEEE